MIESYENNVPNGILRAFLHDLEEAVVILDKDTRIMYANPAYSKVLGIPLSKVIGRRVAEIEPESKALQVYQLRRPLAAEFDIVKTLERPVYFHAIPILDVEEIVAVACLFRGAGREAKGFDAPYARSKIPPDSSASIPAPLAELAGSDRRFLRVLRLASLAAPTTATVLLEGESGTGKELLARAIHFASDRATGNFVVVNCPAIPESLFESELFGYSAGAFTGARNHGKKGKFELADKGTIFLDEVGELSLGAQSKILRVLQEQEIERIGADRTTTINVRVIAATNRPLFQMVKSGEFRLDLYFRLCVIPITVPPLRERLSDLPVLVEKIMQKHAPEKKVAAEVMDLFRRYRWEGNIRQLENVLRYGAYLSQSSTITARDLPPYLGAAAADKRPPSSVGPGNGSRLQPSGSSSVGSSLRERLAREEREALLEALHRCHNNRSAAMRLLGISRKTFYQKLRQHGLSNTRQ